MTQKPDPLPDLIFHICSGNDWRTGGTTGSYAGSSQATADGFLHFSTCGQLATSFAKHYPGPEGLVILSVRTACLYELGCDLRWEVSRGGDLFPHLYGVLPCAAVVSVTPASEIDRLVAETEAATCRAEI